VRRPCRRFIPWLVASSLLGVGFAAAQDGSSVMPFKMTVGGQEVDGSNTDLAYGILRTAVAADAEIVIDKQLDLLNIYVFEVGADDWPKDNPVATINATTNKVKLNATTDGKAVPPGDYHLTIAAGDASALVRFTIGTPGTPSKWAGGGAAAGTPPPPTKTPDDPPKEEPEELPAVANDDQAFTYMCYAVQNDELETLKRWLAKYPKLVNHRNGELLQSACSFARNVEIVRAILDAGGDPNLKQPKTENNCLHIVLGEATSDPEALESVRAICEVLVEKGCDVNDHRLADGYTPIVCAAVTPHVGKEIIEILVSPKDADVNAVSTGKEANLTKGWSVLHYVCDRAPNDVVKNADIVQRGLRPQPKP